MNARVKSQEGVWSIVLAAGEEQGVRPFVQRWLGRHKPKQYCTFVGTRSLFQHTLDRADQLTAADQKVIVLSQLHAWEAWPQLSRQSAGTVILQPADCGTAAGIFLPLTHIKARDPRATVVIYPPDHFVYPEHRFLGSVQRAIWTAERFPDRLVLLGIVPDRLELDYGWIEPGEELYRSSNHRVQAVRTLLPKPTVAEADAALVAGALWNTQVMAAKVETLWNLGWHCVPDLMPYFERLRTALGTSHETRTIEAIYGRMPCHDFVSKLLRHAPDCMAVVEMDGVLWSDWGKPERIANVLRQIGRQPAFPLTCLNRPFAPLSSAGPMVVSSPTRERGDTDYADKKTAGFSFQSCRADAGRRRAPQESA